MNNFQFSIFSFQKKRGVCRSKISSAKKLCHWKLEIGNWKFQQREAGFTLLEMVVSIGIFSVLVVTAIGITIGISHAQIKAANIQAIQDNIRFSLELITKEMRTGYAYALTGYGAACGGGSEISFLTSLSEPRVYYLDNSTKTIMRITGNTNCANAAPFTADEVRVDQLTFQLRGQGTGPSDGQPMATIAMNIRSRSPKYFLESSINLQTTVVQRLRDL